MHSIRFPSHLVNSQYGFENYTAKPHWMNPLTREWLSERGFKYVIREGVEMVEEKLMNRSSAGTVVVLGRVPELFYYLDFEDENEAFEFKVRWV